MYLFFFFKQKTAYEMRISDWSSDVCSSDLNAVQGQIARDFGSGAVDLHCGRNEFGGRILLDIEKVGTLQMLIEFGGTGPHFIHRNFDGHTRFCGLSEIDGERSGRSEDHV